MLATQLTFRITSKTLSFLALLATVLAVVAMVLGNDLALPWHSIPTYVKTPLFLEYFSIGDKTFGLEVDQVLAWQHFSTGDFNYLSWLDYLLFGGLILVLLSISVTLTYLTRSWYLFCTGLMLLILMQLNLGELGYLPDYINYVFFVLFIGLTYYFQSIKTEASLPLRLLSFILGYGLFALGLALLSPIITPVSATVAFGLFAPLILVALLLIFIGGDTMQVLFSIATKSSPSGKNGLFHFMSIGLIYIVLLLLLFLDKTGNISLDLWLFNPYVVLMASLLCGHLSMAAKLAVSESELPDPLISKWLYPAMALLSLVLISYAELSGNDSLSQAFQLSILGTQLAGAVVYYFYALINFTPNLLENEKVTNFFAGFRAPLLTARILHLLFITGVVFYLDTQPYYQARAGRYVALGALAESIDSEVLAEQYYKQATFYDYYNFRSNYSLARNANQAINEAEKIDFYKRATISEQNNKGTIALANYYSKRNQLFNKLLTLKESTVPDYRLTNNLGIAHFEFAHYDSSRMALERSLEQENTKEAQTNRLALGYYVPSMAPEETASIGSARELINLQALANKVGTNSYSSLLLAEDSALYQEELFVLHNLGLNRLHKDENILKAYQYYLASDKNVGLKDFLLLGQAIQAYDAGLVNLAFESMAELLVIDQVNRARNAFTMGLWAAQQQAYLLADEYLDMAISGRYRVEEAMALKEAIKQEAIPEPDRESIVSPASGLSKDQLDEFRLMAQKNAFDIRLTSQALSVLRSEGVEASEIYELLRKAITINPYNLDLMQTYAWQSIKAGLATQGRIGLETLRGKVSEADLNKALADFDQRLTDWRNRPVDQ